MTVPVVLDSAGRRRSPAAIPGYHRGRAPRNKGMRYPADPPTIDEIVAVMRHTREDRHGWRLRAMIVVLWRTGLRI
jgi:integrase